LGLKSVEDDVEELLSVLLLSSVSGLAIKLLEGEAEIRRVEFVSLREFQVSDEFLHLMHHVVVNLLTFVFLEIFCFTVINTEQIVPEGGDHEELLHHRVHVADAAHVA